ncbi:hypothetical protein D3C79_793070 [compost metagenome]
MNFGASSVIFNFSLSRYMVCAIDFAVVYAFLLGVILESRKPRLISPCPRLLLSFQKLISRSVGVSVPDA